jgi:hypothetical protein
MIYDREETLAAHELAWTRIANQKQLNFIPFEKNQKVWLDTRNLKMSHHKKIVPKQEGPFEIDEVLGPVTYETARIMENPQCIPCNITLTIHWEQSLWKQWPKATTRVIRRQRSLWSWTNPQTSEKRKRLSILCEIKRLSHYWGNLGTCISLLYQWRHAKKISRLTSTIEANWMIKNKRIQKEERQ